MSHTLLLADDSLTIRRVIELTFAEEDLTVTAVGDGRRAIECIPSLRPDIVLADAGMTSPDGYDIAAFVKGTPELAHIPVVLLTAAFQPIDEARARAAGCDAVLAKPFELSQLVSRVKHLLRAAGRRAAGARIEPADPGDHEEVPANLPAQATGDASLADAPTEPAGGAEVVGDVVPPPEGPAIEDWLAGEELDARAHEANAWPAATIPSLGDYFDSIDHPVREAGADAADVLPSAGDAALERCGFDADWSADDAREAGISLADCFDMIDAATRQARPAEGAPARVSREHGVRSLGAGSAAREAAGDQPADAMAAADAEPVALPDAATRTFLALLASTVVLPPAPEVVERALRRLLEDGEQQD
jgi:CheY-like chemotaxis protein